MTQLNNGVDSAILGDKVPGFGVSIPGRSAAQFSVLFGPDIAAKKQRCRDFVEEVQGDYAIVIEEGVDMQGDTP